MKKKEKIVLFVLVVIGIITLCLTCKNKKDVTKTKRKQNDLAIMIKEDGAEDYTKSSSKDIPKDNYTLNSDKSYCKNNGVIGDYDSTLGKVSFSFIGTDSCYLYFDYEVPGVKFETAFAANNIDIFDENGLRYEGANPNNYICLDNQKEGACSDSSLLFRIIGLFDEEYSTDGTTSNGSKKLLKVIDTNNYGGADGKYYDVESDGSSHSVYTWKNSDLGIELNDKYLSTLVGSANINRKLISSIVNVNWHLGGLYQREAQKYTADDVYEFERYKHPVLALDPTILTIEDEYTQIGLMYVSDYGYATVGGATTNKSICRETELDYLAEASNNDCKNNNWLFTSQSSFINNGEWLITPYFGMTFTNAFLHSNGNVEVYSSRNLYPHAVRPTFYLDSSILKIVGTGDGSSSNPYRIG